MELEFEVKNDMSSLRILCDGFLLVLSKNKHNIIQWSDCNGSLGQYLFFTDGDSAFQLEREINDNLIYQDLVDSSTINAILKIFPTGKYKVFQFKGLGYCIPVKSGSKQPTNFYLDGSFVLTQKISDLNPERIDFYIDLISKGARPKIVTLSLSFEEAYDAYYAADYYVIDGHHKFLAYEKLKIEPEFLNFHRSYNLDSYNKLIEDNNDLILNVIPDIDGKSLRHIIKNNPKVYYGNSRNEIKYNQGFYDFLLNSKKVERKIVELFKTEFGKNTPESNLWVSQNINIILRSLELHKKLHVYSGGDGQSNSSERMFISDELSFYIWLEKMLKTSF